MKNKHQQTNIQTIQIPKYFHTAKVTGEVDRPLSQREILKLERELYPARVWASVNRAVVNH